VRRLGGAARDGCEESERARDNAEDNFRSTRDRGQSAYRRAFERCDTDGVAHHRWSALPARSPEWMGAVRIEPAAAPQRPTSFTAARGG
jgi:hypothetical protein